jgi:hypothetical protein
MGGGQRHVYGIRTRLVSRSMLLVTRFALLVGSPVVRWTHIVRQGYSKLNVRQGHYTPIASGAAPEARGIEVGC